MNTVTIDKHSKRAETASPVGEVKANDPSIYEQLVQPWELCNTPTERGDFGYGMRYLTMPGITLYREQFDLGCRLQGLSPASVFALTVPLQSGLHSTYWNTPVLDVVYDLTTNTIHAGSFNRIFCTLDLCL